MDVQQPQKFKTSHFNFIIWSVKISNSQLGDGFSYRVYSQEKYFTNCKWGVTCDKCVGIIIINMKMGS